MEIGITESAYEKILDIVVNEPKGTMLRIYVQGGGCSGFQYGFTLDTEQADDDFVIEKSDIKVLVDSMSYQYLTGSTIDYRDELMSSQFVIQNPNAVSHCGCGSSFGI